MLTPETNPCLGQADRQSDSFQQSAEREKVSPRGAAKSSGKRVGEWGAAKARRVAHLTSVTCILPAGPAVSRGPRCALQLLP